MNILINRDGHHMGPFTHDQVCHMLAEGNLQAWDLCWQNGSRDWIALERIPGVSEKTDALRQQRRAEAIAAALNRLVADRRLAAVLGEGGYERARTITWDHVIEKLVEP